MGRKVLYFLVLSLSIAVAPQFSIAQETKAAPSQQVHVPQEIKRLNVGKYINAVAWNADGSRLAALSEYGHTITIWETKSWTVVKEFDRYSGGYAYNSLAFLPDGSLLTSAPVGASPDPKYKSLDIFSLVQWNPDTAKVVRYLPDLGDPPKEIPPNIGPTDTFAVAKDGSLIAGVEGVGVPLYDPQTGSLARFLTVPPTPTHRDMPKSVSVSLDGRELAVGTLFGMVHFFDLATGTLTHSITAFPHDLYVANALALSPDGRFISVGQAKGMNLKNPNDIGVTVWRVKDGIQVSSLQGATWNLNGKDEASTVRTISWSPSGDLLAVGDDYSLHLWDVRDVTKPSLLLDTRMSHGTYSTAFSPQGVLAATDNNEVVIYQ